MLSLEFEERPASSAPKLLLPAFARRCLESNSNDADHSKTDVRVNQAVSSFSSVLEAGPFNLIIRFVQSLKSFGSTIMASTHSFQESPTSISTKFVGFPLIEMRHRCKLIIQQCSIRVKNSQLALLRYFEAIEPVVTVSLRSGRWVFHNLTSRLRHMGITSLSKSYKVL